MKSHVFLCTLAYYLQWHLKQRLEPLFAADGTHKDRQWTLRNVIERLAAIAVRRSRSAAEFEKVTMPEADQQAILDYPASRGRARAGARLLNFGFQD